MARAACTEDSVAQGSKSWESEVLNSRMLKSRWLTSPATFYFRSPQLNRTLAFWVRDISHRISLSSTLVAGLFICVILIPVRVRSVFRRSLNNRPVGRDFRWRSRERHPSRRFRKQLTKFYPRPFGETLSKEPRIGGMQFKTRDQRPVRAVGFAQHATFTTTTRNLSKTAVVGSHKTKNRAGPGTGKRWN